MAFMWLVGFPAVHHSGFQCERQRDSRECGNLRARGIPISQTAYRRGDFEKPYQSMTATTFQPSR